MEADTAKREIHTEGKKFQKVVVNFGNEEEDIKKIPQHVFGKEKTKNAQIFLQKYQEQKEIMAKYKDLPELLDVSTYSGSDSLATAELYNQHG